MNPHNQKMLLQKLQNEAMEILSKAVSVWQLVPHDKFALQPTTDSWSANECLQHLNSYGRYYLPAIEKSLNGALNANSVSDFSPGWLGNYFTKLMLPKTNGVLSKKMKSPKDHVPKQILESHLVIAEFIDQQEKLLLLLQKATHFDLNKSRVGISIAPFIKLKLGDVFMFLIAHLNRHVNQAERALGEVIQKDKSPVL